jgi:aryl-alcohol dehydrogenase-like predicted oxidoreductase
VTSPTPTGITARTLGHSGIEVSSVALGVMMFGRWGNTDVAECHRMLHLALDAGITLVDTADMYDDGASEEILGGALRGRRDQVVLATKVGNPMGGDPDRSGLSRRWIEQALEDSLRRLQVDHVDLYQMHRPDPSTPIEETLEVFDRLVSSGKVRAIGTSTFSPAQLDELHTLAGDRSWVRPTSEQPPYSALARGVETEVLPTLRRWDVGAIVWAPLNGGWLTGKYQSLEGDAASRAQRQPASSRSPGRPLGLVGQARAGGDRLAGTLARRGTARPRRWWSCGRPPPRPCRPPARCARHGRRRTTPAGSPRSAAGATRGGRCRAAPRRPSCPGSSEPIWSSMRMCFAPPSVAIS